MSLLRRFSRRMQESGTIQKVKGKRYSERGDSKLSLKNKALSRMKRWAEKEKQRKMGKIQ